jgi:hypothetical protein
MASKLNIIVTNAKEAEEAATIIMAKIDKLFPLQISYAVKAANAHRECQYRFYKCKFQLIDNQIVELNRTLTEIATFLPMPQNFPL